MKKLFAYSIFSVSLMLSSCAQASSSSSSFISSSEESSTSSSVPSSSKSEQKEIEVNEDIASMYEGAKFYSVPTFVAKDYFGEFNFKGTIASCVKAKSQGRDYYIFDVHTKNSRGNISLYVSFTGGTSSSYESIVFDKTLLYLHEDEGFGYIAQEYVDSINNKEISIDDTSAVYTGATLSCKAIFDAISSSKDAYFVSVLGGYLEGKDPEFDFAKAMYPEANIQKDAVFEVHHYENEVTSKTGGIYTHRVDVIHRYFADGIVIYETQGFRKDEEEESHGNKEAIVAFVSFKESDDLDKTCIYFSGQSYPNQDETQDYADYIISPDYNMDKEPSRFGPWDTTTGHRATQSATLIYYLILSARSLYLEEQNS